MESVTSLEKTFSANTHSSSSRPSTKGSWRRRRKASFHVTSFAFSVACKLMAVYQPPPPMQTIRPSSPVPLATSPVYCPPDLLPIHVYGDIVGPSLSKVILILKELRLPYALKVFDLNVMQSDASLSSNPNRGVPAIEDPNTGMILCESGAIVEYLEDAYDQDNKLRYASFPEKYLQKQWAWHQLGSHESILAYYGFISVHEYYATLLRGTLNTIEKHLNATGNLYLIGDRITYADLMYVASKEVVASTLLQSFNHDFEATWRQEWPRTYDWYQRLLMRPAVKEALDERSRIMGEKGWSA